MNFKDITHVIENPTGHAPGYNYSLVGSVPACMMTIRKATQSDAMGGRAFRSSEGELVALAGTKWRTVQEIIDHAAGYPEVKLCSAPGCTCRKLF